MRDIGSVSSGIIRLPAGYAAFSRDRAVAGSAWRRRPNCSFRSPGVSLFRAFRRALAAWALALPLLALSAPQVQANNPGCSRADGKYQAHENWALTPSNLNEGDKFRLLFASSTTRDARAATNGVYDDFVENRAKAGHSAITDGCAGKFTALISTQGWSARQNTATRATDTDASIWWLAGQKVADDYADFYDGSWDSRNHKNEYGTRTSHDRVWTGSLNNGNVHPTQRAGLSIGNTRLARLGSGSPLSSDARSSAQAHRIFGLSPIFTVVKDPRLSISLDKTSGNELNSGGSHVIVTVKLDRARPNDTSFKMCVKNTSTATFRKSTSANERDFDLYEYSLNAGNLVELTVDASNCHTMTIKKNTSQHRVRIGIYGDSQKEEHEKVVLELKSPSSGVKISSSKGTATYTITNDDSEPTVTITGGATASEGTNATFTVKSSHAPAQALSVKVNITEEEDADTGKNHVAAADEGVRTVTVAAGSTSQSFTVPTSEDWIDEPNGVITATVQAGTGYEVGAAKSAQVNVADDDTRGFRFRPARLKLKEGGTATYTVELTSQPLDEPEGVTVTLTPLGDFTVDTDSSKAGNQTTLRFDAVGGNLWQSGQTVTVTADEDANSTDDTTAINHEGSGAGYGPRPGDDFGALRGIVVTVTDNDVPHLVVAPTALSVTEGGSSTFTVKLGTQPSADGSLAFASTNPDITFSPASLSYFDNDHNTKGWDKARTVTVHAASDNDIGDDTATLTVTASGGDYEGKTATIAATVTDTSTPALVLSTSTLSVNEGASTTYTVALAAKPTGPVTVAIGSNNADVTVDTDTGTSGNQNRLTFNATGSNLWSTAQTVTVNARGDVDTASEAVTLTHTASGGGYGAVRKTLSGTVTDDGKKTVAFAQTDYPVIEGKGPVTVTLVLSEARSTATNVSVSATGLTATGHGVDYSGGTWTVTFAAGSTRATFEIPITADNILENAGGETARLDIHDFGLPADLKKVHPHAAYVTIYDAPVLSFTRPDTTTVFEGGRALEFTLEARAPYFDEADGSHGFAHMRLSGRARQDIDYRIEYWFPGLGWLKARNLIAIPVGKPSARVRVTALEDGRKEGSETATLTLIELPKVYRDTGQPFYRAGSPRTVNFTVADRETVEPEVTSIAHHDPAASTAVSPASLTWRVTFNEEVHGVDASDFTLTGTSATLAVERVSGSTFDVTASGGNLGRITGGQVVLGLARDNDITDGSGNAFTRWLEFTSTYWVHDGSTPPPLPVVTVTEQSPGFVTVEGTRAGFTLTATPVPAEDLTVNFTLSQSGDAIYYADDLRQHQITIKSGGSSASINYSPRTRNDSVDEPDGGITVTLDSGTGYTVGSPSSQTISIRDDDPTVVSLARTGSGAVTEGGTVELDVTLARALVAGETIDAPLAIGGTGVTTGDWSLAPKPGATNTGVTLLDAGTTTQKVRFEGAGAQTATLELTAMADGTAEGSETFTIALGADSAFDEAALGTNVGGGADPHGTDNAFDVTVNDGAAPPPGTPAVQFASATSSAAEDAGTHSVTLDLAPAAPSGGLTLAYAVTGTATAGSGNDFTIQGSGTLGVAAGATAATLAIAINDDSIDDDAETVVLTLNPGTGYTLGGTTIHTLTIADNDDPITPAACVSAQLLSDVQGYAGESRPNSPDHVPRWRRVLAAFGESNSYSNNPMTVSEAQTQADRGLPRWVPVVTALECLEGTTPTGPQITVQGGSGVTEGGNAVFTVSASPAPAASLTVSLTVGDDANSDFLAQADEGTRTVTIAGGQTSATLSLTTQDDSTDEADGSVTAAVSSGTGYTVGSPSTATVAVADNDPAPQGTPVVSIAAGAGVTEGGNAQFTLTASPAPTASITVGVAVAQSGAFATSGQTGTRAVTIGSSGTAILTVATDNDSADEANGSITATVQTGTGYTAHGTNAAATVAVADDDVPVVSITGGAGVTEGMSASFTVSASPVPFAPLGVTLTIGQSGDFAASGQTGSRAVTVPVTGNLTVEAATVDDAADEPDGTITATLGTGTGYTVAAAPDNAATVAVSDNDAASSGPTLSIADATFNENADRVYFTVTLSEPVDRTITVRFATRDSTPVSARADQDYLAWKRSWQVWARFRPGETETRIFTYIYNDSHDEDPETFEMVLFDASDGVSIADGVAVGTIVNDDPMPAAWLARFGRTIAEQALDGISDRMAASREAGVEGGVAGMGLDFGPSPEDEAIDHSREADAPFSDGPERAESLSVREALLGSSFTVTGETDGMGGSLAFWGRAAQSSFDGREGSFSLDGEATTAMLGADYARDNWLVGLALMQSTGKGDYADNGVTPRPDFQTCPEGVEEVLCSGAVREGDGKVEATLTAALPYAALQASERLKLWGALGHGAGEVTLEPELGGVLKSDISWTMASFGLRGDVIAPPADGPALALVSDALWARTSSEKTSELAAADSDVTRLRLGLEGSWSMALQDGGSVRPTLEAGLRHDGGDAETGFGVELGGGFAWEAPRLGLSLDLSGRRLVTHDADDLEDRGFAASLAFDPDPSTERGLSLALGQEIGGASSGGLDALFQIEPLSERAGSESDTRWTAEAAWGFPAFSRRFTGSPHIGLGIATGARDYTLGWRLTPETGGLDLGFGVTATRSESDGAEPQHGIGFELNMRW